MFGSKHFWQEFNSKRIPEALSNTNYYLHCNNIWQSVVGAKSICEQNQLYSINGCIDKQSSWRDKAYSSSSFFFARALTHWGRSYLTCGGSS